MLNILYTISPEIESTLKQCDRIRETILLLPVRPKTLRQYQWNIMINRLMGFTAPYEKRVSLKDIESLLWRTAGLPRGNPLQMLVNYRHTLSEVFENWIANTEPVTPYDIYKIASRLTQQMKHIKTSASISEENLDDLLSWVSRDEDHPIISAGIIFSQLSKFDIDRPINPLASVSSYIFFSRRGYDILKLISFENRLSEKLPQVQNALKEGLKTNNWNTWLLLFTKTVKDDLTDLESRLLAESSKSTSSKKDLIDVTLRQQKILAIIDSPTARITNREVARRFKVSQITASRDLSHLTMLGLLAPHGKGRAVNYTKL